VNLRKKTERSKKRWVQKVACVNHIPFLMPDIFQTLHITVKYYASLYLNDVLIPGFVFRRRTWLTYAAMSYLLVTSVTDLFVTSNISVLLWK